MSDLEEKKDRRLSAKIGLLEHFRKIASFRGREDRASFWPYAALVLGIVMIAGFLMTIPMMVQSMQAMQEFNVQGSDPGLMNNSYGLEEFSTPGQVDVPERMPSSGFIWAYLAVTFGLAVVLYAAAVVRRLHDRGRSGAWALLPLPFVLYTSVQVPRMFGSIERGGQPDMVLFLSLFLSSILFWIALGALVVLLAGPGDPGPNRHDLEK